MLNAAIFDIDGTLLDSMWVWDDMGAGYLRDKGLPQEENLNDILLPMSLEEGATYLKEHFGLEEDVPTVMQELLGYVRGFYDKEVQLKPGVIPLLKELRKQGVPMACATANDASLMKMAFRRLGLDEYFVTVLSCQDVGAPKGDPLLYNQTAQMLGATPEETIVFEDGLRGLLTAKEAGYKTVGICDENSRTDWDNLREAADLCVDTLEDVTVNRLLAMC